METIMKFIEFEDKIKNQILTNFKHDTSIDESWSALMLIIKHRGTYEPEKVIDILIEKGNVNYKNKNDTTALMLAVTYGDTSTVEKLIQKGADINLTDKQGFTALMKAASYSYPTINVNNLVILNNSFEQMTITNIEKITDILLEHDADVNKLNILKKSALICAIENPENINVNFNIIKKLLEHKANVNTRHTSNKTPLISAIEMFPTNKRTLEIVKLLLHQGAEVNIEDDDGNTPLNIAISFSSLDLVKLLDKAEINYIDIDGRTPLLRAIWQLKFTNDKTQTDIIRFLLNKENINVNQPDIDGTTSLMYAARYSKNDDIIKLLLEKKADITPFNSKGESAYNICLRNRQISPETTLMLKPKMVADYRQKNLTFSGILLGNE
jgi:uncharacterized protein